MSFDVITVGGGLAGSTLATELQVCRSMAYSAEYAPCPHSRSANRRLKTSTVDAMVQAPAADTETI